MLESALIWGQRLRSLPPLPLTGLSPLSQSNGMRWAWSHRDLASLSSRGKRAGSPGWQLRKTRLLSLAERLRTNGRERWRGGGCQARNAHTCTRQGSFEFFLLCSLPGAWPEAWGGESGSQCLGEEHSTQTSRRNGHRGRFGAST